MVPVPNGTNLPVFCLEQCSESVSLMYVFFIVVLNLVVERKSESQLAQVNM
jgi:hypothetical protein